MDFALLFDRLREEWEVLKKAPLTVAFLVLVVFGAAFWTASTLNDAQVSSLRAQNDTLSERISLRDDENTALKSHVAELKKGIAELAHGIDDPEKLVFWGSRPNIIIPQPSDTGQFGIMIQPVRPLSLGLISISLLNQTNHSLTLDDLSLHVEFDAANDIPSNEFEQKVLKPNEEIVITHSAKFLWDSFNGEYTRVDFGVSFFYRTQVKQQRFFRIWRAACRLVKTENDATDCVVTFNSDN